MGPRVHRQGAQAPGRRRGRRQGHRRRAGGGGGPLGPGTLPPRSSDESRCRFNLRIHSRTTTAVMNMSSSIPSVQSSVLGLYEQSPSFIPAFRAAAALENRGLRCCMHMAFMRAVASQQQGPEGMHIRKCTAYLPRKRQTCCLHTLLQREPCRTVTCHLPCSVGCMGQKFGGLGDASSHNYMQI